jgi:hypothetical protein
MYDHTVFVTYSLSFMMLLTIVLSGADWIGTPGVPIAAMLVPPWHVYRQTRGTYGLSRKSALWRTAALMVIAALALAVFTLALLAIGLL